MLLMLRLEAILKIASLRNVFVIKRKCIWYQRSNIGWVRRTLRPNETFPFGAQAFDTR